MTKTYEIYLCEICGNMVEVVEAGPGELVCCGQKMSLQQENTKEASLEKHVPVVERHADKIRVKVGSIAHPMEAAHYIQWIELIEPGRTQRIELAPDDAPEAEFCAVGDDFTVRAYCNLHGLWKR